jgi:hypothetical protein
MWFHLKEMVLDNVNGTTVPRYLIYDIIKFRGEDTGKMDFRIRLTCIRVSSGIYNYLIVLIVIAI